jgi:hypothetical protein
MDFQTQLWVCNLMKDMVPKEYKTVLEPTPGEGNLVKALESNGFIVTAPKDFWEISGFYDAVIMNPPFTPMALGYKILYSTMEMTNHVIALLPWLTIINSERRTKDILDYGLKSITHLPRNAFPGSRVQTCILDMPKGYKGGCEIKFASKN